MSYLLEMLLAFIKVYIMLALIAVGAIGAFMFVTWSIFIPGLAFILLVTRLVLVCSVLLTIFYTLSDDFKLSVLERMSR